MIKDMVSIITPCYNGSRFISQTIDSVLAQSWRNWEMIIVDDGSVDNSAEIIEEYSQKDRRIQYVYQENAGSAAARNKGIRLARGQYIALLDADDLWDPDFLKRQIRFMKRKDAVCVFSSFRRIDEQGREVMRPTIAKKQIGVKEMKVMNQIGCLTGLYDTSRYGKIYLREELKSLRDDYAYWYDIVSLENKAYGNRRILASYRVLSDSTTGNKKKLIGKQYKFYRSYLKENPFTAAVNIVRWGISGLIKFHSGTDLIKKRKKNSPNPVKKDGFKAVKDSFRDMEGFRYLEGEELIRLQNLLYDMLCDFVKVLEEHHIFYTLSGGSVLGAIRHQGFIPWDDDIDINIPRKEYEKLKKIFEKELGDRYVLHSPELSSGYGFSVAHFGKKDTLYRIFNNIDLPEEDCCIGFDIFVLENTFNNKVLRKLQGLASLAVGYLLNCRKVYDYYPVMEKTYKINEETRKQFLRKYKTGRALRFIPLDVLARLTWRCYSICKNNHSRYVTIPSGRKHFFGEMGLREDMCQGQKARFRDLNVNIPQGTDRYMKRLYGDDYMTVPRQKDREQHPVIEIDFGK